MRLWVINLKKNKQKKTLQEQYVIRFKVQNTIKIKKKPINSFRNIWKIQLLKLYNPSKSRAVPGSSSLNDYKGNCG